MKTTSANMDTHLGLSSTTLAICIKLTRQDGTIFGFTTHDIDIPFDLGDGDGEISYEASSGYLRGSNLQSSAQMNVDNAEFDAFMSSDKLVESELRNGVFDNAEIRMFVVNHQDLTMGDIKMARGWLGNISIGRYAFEAEFRRMLQAYSRKVLRIHAAECPIDFTGPECGLDENDFKHFVKVDTVTDSQIFTVIEFVEETTDAMTVTNPDAETGDLTGWTGLLGDIRVLTGNYARSGTYGFVLAASAASRLQSDEVDLVSDGIAANIIDAGLADYDLSVWQWNEDHILDLGQVFLRFYDSSHTLISSVSTSLTGFTVGTWNERTLAGTYPDLTRYVRIELYGERGSPTWIDVAFDDITLNTVWQDPAGTPDDIPELDTVDFFVWGWAEWLTGDNINRRMEIIIYDSGTYKITLFENVSYDIAVGDWLAIFQGCNKTVAQCRDDFGNIVNFRGFPYLPLNDVLEYPDAQ